jgi:hypothetical protein
VQFVHIHVLLFDWLHISRAAPQNRKQIICDRKAMPGFETQIRTPKVCELPVSDVAESLAHPKTYATETVLKAILISLCNVSGTACTNFKMTMMST